MVLLWLFRTADMLLMKRILSVLAAALSLMFTGSGARAQMPGGGQSGVNAAMLKLFSDISGFTSKAEARLTDKGTKEVTTMTMGFSMLERKVRLDLDMTQIKSKQVTKESVAALKTSGLDRLATVVRPDRKIALIIYPSIAGYVELPMSRDEAADMDRTYSVSKVKLGRETIDGHPCEQFKVTLSSANAPNQEAVVSYASDLRNFPVKIEMNQAETQLVMLFKDVQLARPDVKIFEAPGGYTRHVNIELLMQSAMLKTLVQPRK